MLLEVLREFIRHVFTSSVGSSALILISVLFSAAALNSLNFQRFRFVFHKVRKAVARIVVHKGDQLLTSSFTHALQKLVLL